MYMVFIAENMAGSLAGSHDGIIFYEKDEYKVKEHISYFSQKGFDVMVRYSPDEKEGE